MVRDMQYNRYNLTNFIAEHDKSLSRRRQSTTTTAAAGANCVPLERFLLTLV